MSLVRVCSLPSASEEVVTSLMTTLIDMAIDKVAVKTGSDEKMGRKANIVQRKSLELKAGGKNGSVSRERLEKVKAASGSKSFIPMWVEEPSLPSGWKSCVAAPGKAALYYSPCGNLFTSWAQVEKFLGPAVMKEISGAEEMQSKDEAVKQESFKTEKSPSEGKRMDLSAGKEGSGRKDNKNKNALGSLKKASKSVEKEAFKPKDRMVKSYSKLSGDLELSDDVISLSDEELTMETSVEKKRKKTSENQSKSSKSKKHRTDVKIKPEKKADKNSPVLSSLDSNFRPSKEQEEILLAAFRQWPVAFPELVEALVKETKLEGSQVKQWFLRTRQDCLCLLWESL